MTRRRRAAVLLALAAALGLLSAAHMSRREAALRAQLGPLTEVVVARTDLAAGATLELSDLGVRSLPARYAPAGEPVFAAALAGHKLAVPVAAGGAVTPDLLQRAPPAPAAVVKRGERAVDVVAGGPVEAGARVDVVVTTDKRTQLALQNVEVLKTRPAPANEDAGPRVTATLRVSAADAVFLVAAQSFARDVRLLARAPGDSRTAAPLTVRDSL
jgi:pilus assembly protein CpaB